MNHLHKAAIFSFLFAAALITNAQTLRVQILNGKTGKPVASEHVNLFRAEGFGDLTGNRDVAGFTTDANGLITTSAMPQKFAPFFASVDWHRQCTKSNPVAFSLKEIFAKGVVSENACKPKLERTGIPGTLILFVRDETFFEKMAH